MIVLFIVSIVLLIGAALVNVKRPVPPLAA